MHVCPVRAYVGLSVTFECAGDPAVAPTEREVVECTCHSTELSLSYKISLRTVSSAVLSCSSLCRALMLRRQFSSRFACPATVFVCLNFLSAVPDVGLTALVSAMSLMPFTLPDAHCVCVMLLCAQAPCLYKRGMSFERSYSQAFHGILKRRIQALCVLF